MRAWAVVILFAAAIGTRASALPPAGTYRILSEPSDPSAGWYSQASLVADSQGNLYGTERMGGNTDCFSGCGTVFRLEKPTHANGTWIRTTLYEFTGGADSASPEGPLTLTSDGSLYGTTTGVYANDGDAGSVFRLVPPAQGSNTWTYQNVHRFMRSKEGGFPRGALLIDRTGAIFGYTGSDGGSSWGAIYRIDPDAEGAYHFRILHVFTGKTEGGNPSNIIFDGAQSILATTTCGGSGDCSSQLNPGEGTLIRLSRSNGTTVLFTFGAPGALQGAPVPGLILLADGSVIGASGVSTPGMVYRLAPPAAGSGTWIGSSLYTFAGGSDGYAASGPVQAPSGRLYGITTYGGLSPGFGFGTIYELDPPAAPGGAWQKIELHQFGTGRDGIYPCCQPLLDRRGVLYVTTPEGNHQGRYGTVSAETTSN